ncbi:MAG: hypothetical protein LPK20_10660, partial [Halomonas sp.]|nr:hypothetical protein [Halomonas sp.]
MKLKTLTASMALIFAGLAGTSLHAETQGWQGDDLSSLSASMSVESSSLLLAQAGDAEGGVEGGVDGGV